MTANHTRLILREVADERLSQEAQWGEQNHPSIDESGVGDPRYLFPRYGLESRSPTGGDFADGFKSVTDRLAKFGALTYADILMEEVAEAIEAAATSEGLLREELVQVAAVTVAWIEAIDRRAAKAKEVSQ